MEFKTLCCAASGVMLYLDMQEGATRMEYTKYVSLANGSRSAAAMLRAVEKYQFTGRCVSGDSWFGGPISAIALSTMGLHSLLVIKDFRRFGFAEARVLLEDELKKQSLASGLSEELFVERGAYLVGVSGSATTTFTVPQVGVAAEPKEFTLTATANVTNEHTVVVMGTVLQNEEGGVFKEVVKHRLTAGGTVGPVRNETRQSGMHAMYRKTYGCVDTHNHERQGLLAMHRSLHTDSWIERTNGELHGIVATNVRCFLECNPDQPGKVKL
jgi:hypothetical protein